MKPTDDVTADREASETKFDIVANTEPLSRSEWLREQVRLYVVAPFLTLWEDWRTQTGLAIVLVYVLMGTVGVRLIPPPSTQGPQLQPAFQSLEYPLGTDQIGQSLLALIVHGTPEMLLMVFSGGAFTAILATIVGSLAGYKGGLTDRVLMTISDVIMTIPGLPLVIVLGIIFEPTNPVVIGVLLSINAWAGLARAIRSEVLSLREESYVEAARLMGVSTPAIIYSDLLPSLMPYILVNFVYAGRTVIFSAVALYFIGALPFNQLNWGVILNSAYRNGALYSWQGFHWLILPIVAITGLVVGLILFAQGAERIFNPRIMARHAQEEERQIAPDQ